jgi:hypothetical protein
VRGASIPFKKKIFILKPQSINKSGKIMLAGWKNLDGQNNSLIIDLSEEDLDDY